ncbi:MAG: hypothetical protein DRN04_03000 [Thermoprotei archaeon]|nr:MAG: hypothetical protein DRN04_03000 [Thermoprotei archaeon]
MIKTTYVGSFPLDYSEENIVRILKDIEQIPIDYPCYPQLVDFIKQFLEPLASENIGIEYKEDKFFMAGELKTLDKPIATKALEITVNYFKGKAAVEGVRACVTGPFTLASQIIVPGKKRGLGFENTVLTKPETVGKLAEIVANICKYYAELGAAWINIDEPVLSVIVGRRKILYGYTEDQIVEILNKVISKVQNKITGIHVCGAISPLLRDILLKTEFKILDHEFKGTPSNIDIFERRVIEKYDKKLSFGCVSSKDINIEKIDEVLNLLEKAFEKIGLENIEFIKPDCGFRGLRTACASPEEAYKIALEKLRVLKKVRDLANNKYRE